MDIWIHTGWPVRLITKLLIVARYFFNNIDYSLLCHLLLGNEVVVRGVVNKFGFDVLPLGLAHLIVVADGDGGKGDVPDMDSLRVERHQDRALVPLVEYLLSQNMVNNIPWTLTWILHGDALSMANWVWVEVVTVCYIKLSKSFLLKVPIAFLGAEWQVQNVRTTTDLKRTKVWKFQFNINNTYT